jgi:hypothetical protein
MIKTFQHAEIISSEILLKIAFDFPVIRSVSSEISCLTTAAWDKKIKSKFSI